MTDFYYDGPIVMTAAYEPGFGLRSEVWLKWAVEESDLASSLVEALGIDEHSLSENGEAVEVHARVHVSFDPYRDKLNAEELRLQGGGCMKMPNIEQHVIWHGDGRYSPSCEVCKWEGKPRANHTDTRAAVLAHLRTKRHQDRARESEPRS